MKKQKIEKGDYVRFIETEKPWVEAKQIYDLSYSKIFLVKKTYGDVAISLHGFEKLKAENYFFNYRFQIVKKYDSILSKKEKQIFLNKILNFEKDNMMYELGICNCLISLFGEKVRENFSKIFSPTYNEKKIYGCDYDFWGLDEIEAIQSFRLFSEHRKMMCAFILAM